MGRDLLYRKHPEQAGQKAGEQLPGAGEEDNVVAELAQESHLGEGQEMAHNSRNAWDTQIFYLKKIL